MRETSTLVQGPSIKQCGTLIGANSTSMRRRSIKLLQWIEHETACRNSSATCSPNGGPPKRGNTLRARYRARNRARYRARYRGDPGKQSILAFFF